MNKRKENYYRRKAKEFEIRQQWNRQWKFEPGFEDLQDLLDLISSC